MKQNPFQYVSVGAAVAAILGSAALQAPLRAAEGESLEEVTVTG